MDIDNQLMEVAKQNNLTSENKINELMQIFAGNFNKAKEAVKNAKQIIVTDETQIDLMAQARGKRLELKEIRVDVEKTRKELKEQSLREGKVIDGVANIIKALIIPVEQHLEKQEKFAERILAEKQARIKAEREMKLSQYIEDISLYNLDKMTDDVFNTLLNNAKTTYKAKIEAEKKAEADRIAKSKEDEAERERIRLENIKLKAEAELREKKLEEERAKQAKILEDERKKREAIEKKIREEKEERERKEREAKAIEEAKLKAEAELKRKALLAPDKDKLIKLASDINSISYPAVSSDEAMNLVKSVKQSLYKIADEIVRQANNLK